MKRTLNRPMTLLAGAALAVLLAACGGGAETSPEASAYAQGQARLLGSPQPIAPLLDEEGNTYLSGGAAVPADAGAQTRSGRYATAAQADQLEHALGARTLSVIVEAGPDASAEVDSAVQVLSSLQRARDLRADAPVFVRGSDLRLAATLANRLEGFGYSRVFVVNGRSAERE